MLGFGLCFQSNIDSWCSSVLNLNSIRTTSTTAKAVVREAHVFPSPDTCLYKYRPRRSSLVVKIGPLSAINPTFSLVAQSYGLENQAMVTYSAGHSFAVEILQQRDGILSRNACEFFELVHIDPGLLGLLFRQLFPQPADSAAMEDEIIGNFDQDLIAEKQGYDFLSTRSINFETREYVFQRRHGKAGGGKCLLDDLLRLCFFILHHNAAPCQPDKFSHNFELLRLSKGFHRGRKYLGLRCYKVLKLISADARDQWILLMKLVNRSRGLQL